METGGYEFEVTAVANFAVTGHEFDADGKRLTLHIDSRASSGLAEIAVPSDLIGGNLTFHLDGEEVRPRVLQGAGEAVAVLEFEGAGERRLDIVGTTYLPELPAAALALAAATAAGAAISRRAPAGLLRR